MLPFSCGITLFINVFPEHNIKDMYECDYVRREIITHAIETIALASHTIHLGYTMVMSVIIVMTYNVYLTGHEAQYPKYCFI